jgi:hypothetical protein
MYPNVLHLPDDYSGCIKTWVADNNAPPRFHLLTSEQFKNGFMTELEDYSPEFGNKKSRLNRTCRYSETTHALIQGSDESCNEMPNFTIEKSRNGYLSVKRAYEEK